MIGPRRTFLGFILEEKAAVRTVLGSDTAIAESLIRWKFIGTCPYLGSDGVLVGCGARAWACGRVEGVRDMCHVRMHQSGRTWLIVRHIYIQGSIPT